MVIPKFERFLQPANYSSGVNAVSLMQKGVPSVVAEAYRLEQIQGKNLVHAVATALDSLDLFIFSGLSAAKDLSGGEFKQIYHFDAKAETIQYLEANYPELAPKTAVLQLGMFMTNTRAPSPLKPTKVGAPNNVSRVDKSDYMQATGWPASYPHALLS